MRRKKFVLNTVTAFLNQIVSLICGFILPRQILLAYGSDVNGLVSSITQFLGFIAFLEMGVGSVVQTALYKPLSKENDESISYIVIASNKFFRKIAAILIIYTIILMFFFPLVIDRGNGIICTAILVFSISISSVFQYLFGVTKQLLLNADQKSYVQLIPQTVVTILNTIISIILISYGSSINTVKLVSAFIFLGRPLWMSFYVRRNYNINYQLTNDKDPLKQKWNAVAQHIATFVADKTDIMILTLFSSLTNVSIYYVYHLIVNGLSQTFGVVISSLQALFGDMYVKNEIKKLKFTYNIIEWAIHSCLVFLFACTKVLILPFVQVYTKGVDDANYILPWFSVLITIAFMLSCFRFFYNLLIKSVGHYKETQASAIIEALLNLGISVVLVSRFELIGVAVGTIVSMLYRAIYLKLYTDIKVLKQKLFPFVKQVVFDVFTFVLIIVLTSSLSLTSISYFSWFFLALRVSGIAIVIVLITNLFFYKKNIIALVKYIKGMY